MFRSGLYNLLGGAVRIAVTLVTIPLLLRIVGVEEYGLLTLVLTAINLVTLAEAGLPVATTVFVARDRLGQNATALSQTLTICLFATLLLATCAAGAIWLGSAGVARLYPSLSRAQSEAVAQSLRWGAVVVWVRLLQQVLIGVEQAYHRYGWLNIVNTAQTLLSNLGMLLVAIYGGRAAALIWWQALIGALIIVVHGAYCARLLAQLRLRPAWDTARAREIARFSGYAWVSALGTVLFSQCDRLIVGAVLGIRPLGVYGAITSAAAQINGLSGLVVQPLMPAISAHAALHELSSATVRAQLKRAWQTLALIAFGVGGALFVLAPLVLRFGAPELFSPQGIGQLRIAIAIYTVYSMNAFGYFVLLGTERAQECMLIVLGSGLLSLLLVAVGASVLGLTGALLGNAGYFATLLLVQRSLKGLPVGSKNLVDWIGIPVIWLVVTAAASLLADDRTGVLLGVCLVQSILLCAWYLSTQRSELRLARLLAAARKAHS